MPGKKRKAEVVQENDPLPTEDAQDGEISSAEKKKKKPKKPLDAKFGGKTEEEVMALFLPDHLKPNLDIVFIGINPGLYSAYLGHHYCNANNHFWPCLYESGLIPRQLTYWEDAQCMDYGLGFTNIVPRTTRSADELSRKEMKEWSKVMIERMKELKPLVACFNGKGIYEIFSGKKCEVGIQPDPLPDTETAVYVMPSTSGRAATYPKRADKLRFFVELKQLRDTLRAKYGRLPLPIPSQPSVDPTMAVVPESDRNSLSIVGSGVAVQH